MQRGKDYYKIKLSVRLGELEKGTIFKNDIWRKLYNSHMKFSKNQMLLI
jgi:hypothetical protein